MWRPPPPRSALDAFTLEDSNRYRRGANQGYAEAQNNLGNLYHGGKGVDNDLAQAFKWWGLAAIQGQPEAVKSLRSLVGRLNNTQVNKGRTLINDFTPLSE